VTTFSSLLCSLCGSLYLHPLRTVLRYRSLATGGHTVVSRARNLMFASVEKWSTAALFQVVGAAKCYHPRAVRAAGLVNHTSKLKDAVRGAFR
jgi:hypothetical protein